MRRHRDGSASKAHCGSRHLSKKEVADFSNAFTISVKTDNPGTSSNTSFTIPGNSAYTYNANVDWGDGSTSTMVGSSLTHDYGTAGTYTIKIAGTFPAIYFNMSGDRRKLISVTQWGNIEWYSFENSFYGCDKFNITASDSPDLSNASSMRGAFRQSTMNASIAAWNLVTITDMEVTWRDNTVYNQSFGSADLSNVTKWNGAFRDATAFNQDLSGNNISGDAGYSFMFQGATSFNGGAAAGVSNTGMFNISPTVSGNQLYSMFNGATVFNCAFTLDSSGVTSGTLDLTLMLSGATSFDQALYNPVGPTGWNWSKVGNMTNFLQGVTLSTANYDLNLRGLNDGTLGLTLGIVIDGGNSVYTTGGAGEAARTSLVGKGCTITDGGGT